MGTVVIALLIGSIVLVSIFSGMSIMNEKDKQPPGDKPEGGGGKGPPPKSDKPHDGKKG